MKRKMGSNKTGKNKIGNKLGSRKIFARKKLYALVLAGILVCTMAACGKEEGQEDSSAGSLPEQTETAEVTEAPSTPEPGTAESSAEPSVEEEEPDILEQLGVTLPEKTVDFGELQEKTNKDIYAWIYIPDTKIDYPVLQHPTDNTYYLNYNLDGSRGYPGCIYTEDYNARDFSDPVTVVYGHNMKNGSMFAGLHKYSDVEYMEGHPYVFMYMEDRLYVYEIFAAYEYSNEHLLYNSDYSQKAQFEKYLENMETVRDMGKVIREDVEVGAEDRILTLSTCISNKPNNRFLVQAVLLNGEEAGTADAPE